MKTSENINELALALAKAQGEIKGAAKDGTNPHFKSSYTTLGAAWDVCRGPLAKNGLAVVQSPSTTPEGLVLVTTLLMHSSGQWLEDSFCLAPRDQSPQSYGSAVTYGRRYSLQGMVGIASEDDDGNAASVAPAAVPMQSPHNAAKIATPMVAPKVVTLSNGKAPIAKVIPKETNPDEFADLDPPDWVK